MLWRPFKLRSLQWSGDVRTSPDSVKEHRV